MRERTGQILENKETNKWIARVCYKNSNGKRTAIQRIAESKTDTKKALKQIRTCLGNCSVWRYIHHTDFLFRSHLFLWHKSTRGRNTARLLR
jgi:hypothetical protein